MFLKFFRITFFQLFPTELGFLNYTLEGLELRKGGDTYVVLV